jgi:hypothetical protein
MAAINIPTIRPAQKSFSGKYTADNGRDPRATAKIDSAVRIGPDQRTNFLLASNLGLSSNRTMTAEPNS